MSAATSGLAERLWAVAGRSHQARGTGCAEASPVSGGASARRGSACPPRSQPSYRTGSSWRSVLRRPCEQVVGVRARRLRVVMAAHHPGQLTEPLVAVDGAQPGGRDGAVVALEDDEVAVAVRSHLREVGHDDDLGEARKTCQPAADLERHRATDAGVDLVEHERLPASRVSEYDLERQPYPRQ